MRLSSLTFAKREEVRSSEPVSATEKKGNVVNINQKEQV